MASYDLVCEGATSVPVITGTLVDACTDAGGVLAYVEVGSILPALTLAEGGAIATALIALWALAWAFRVLQRQIEES